jgi:hypothetical protein
MALLVGVLAVPVPVSTGMANDPTIPAIEVPLGSALAQRAIQLALPEFEKNGLARTESYVPTVSHSEHGVSVVFFDSSDCQPPNVDGALRSPILFVTLYRDADRVFDTYVNRTIVCPKS